MSTHPTSSRISLTLKRFFVTSAAMFVVSGFFVSSAFAAQTITSATVNGGSTVTVAGGASVTVNAIGDLTAGSIWHGTQSRVSTTPPGTTTCNNTTNFDANGTGLSSGNFTVTAPGTSGTYNLYLQMNSQSGCGGTTGTTFTLASAVVVDATAPTVSTVSTAHADGSFKTGEVIDFNVAYSENVTVTGTPLLALNSGGSASYLSGSGGSTLVFRYTVGAAENAADLANSATGSLTLNGGTIKDSVGNNAVNTLPAPAVFQGAHAIVIDTTAPVIPAHSAVTATATALGGATVAYTAPTTTDNLDVAPVTSCLPASGTFFAMGTSTITCNANDAAGNAAVATTFTVTVSPDVVSASQSTVTAGTNISTAGGLSTVTITAKDQFGNPIPNILKTNVVVSVLPTTGTTVIQPAVKTNVSGLTTAGVQSTVATTNTVTVVINGTTLTAHPTIVFLPGVKSAASIAAAPSSTVEASLSGTSVTLTITVTDVNGNLVADDTTVSLSSTLGTVSGTGNTVNGVVTRTLTYNNKGDATLTASGLTVSGDTVIHFVDTTKPVLTLVSTDPITVEYRGTYTDPGATALDNIDGNITGSITSDANLVDTNIVQFQPAHSGQVIASFTVTYNVSDGSGNAATPITRVVNVIDTTAPVVASLTSDATAAGALKIGDTITFTLTPSIAEAIATVSGSYNGRALVWSTANAGVTYTATYTVLSGDTDQTSPLQISGVTITDEANNTSAAASSTNVAKTIDANVPTVTVGAMDTTNANAAWAKTGDTITLHFTTNEAVQTSPVVTIDGQSAVVAQDGNNATWTATYTLTGTDTEGAIPYTIAYIDLAGNAGAPAAGTGSVTFDRTAPATPVVSLTNPVNAANQTATTISGTGEANGTVNYSITNGVTVNGTSTVSGGGVISVTGVDVTTVTDGTLNLSVTVTDAAGNVSSAGVNTAIKDTAAPTIDPHADITGVEATSPAGAVVTYTSPATHDVVDGDLVATCLPASGSTFALATTTVTCNQTDAAGNAATPTTFTVTVVDTTAPVVTAPSDEQFEATGPTTTPTLVQATSLDIVDLSSAVISYAPQTFSLGTTVVTWTATDAHGNAGTATSNVTIVDTTAPVIASHATTTAEATGPTGATVTYTSPTATDLVDSPITVTCLPASGSLFAIGDTAVTCNASDLSGNAATSTTFNVSVVDTTAPVIASHANVTVEATSLNNTVVAYTNPSSTDIVDGSVAVNCIAPSGSQFILGTTAVNCSATDAHANTATSTFNVIVVDTTAPSITSPADINQPANGFTSTVVLGTPVVSDAVDASPVVTNDAPGTFPLGVTVVTWTATDFSGNSATSTQTVTIVPAAIAKLTISAAPTSTQLAGVAVALTVNGRDQWNNITTNQSGTTVVLSVDNGGALDDTIVTLTNGAATTNLNKSSAGVVHVTASSGILTPGAVTMTFTPSDVTAPTITSFSPILNATNVAVNAPIFVNFSETLKASTVNSANIQLWNSNGGSPVQVSATISLVEGGTRANITPNSTLDFDTHYYMVVTAGVTDEAGNAVSNPLDDTTTGFTTVADTSDVTGPTIVDHSPSNASSTNVSINVAPSMTFSEPVKATTVNTATITLTDGTTPVSATISLVDGGTRAVITPASPLAYSTSYTFDASSSVTDEADNALTGTATFGFTTQAVPPDTTAPVISNVQVASTTAHDAVITWTTDEASDSQVEYGGTSAYGLTSATSSALVTSHSVTLSGLADITTYHFRVKSADAASNLGVSNDNSFTTIVDDSTAVLAITGIDALRTTALPDDTYGNGFQWKFHVTVPTVETTLRMKFSDFVNGTSTIPVASNLRFYSAQSSNAADASSSITLTAADTYSADMLLVSDLAANTAGRQVDIFVELKVPVSTIGGSYSSSYGIQSVNGSL